MAESHPTWRRFIPSAIVFLISLAFQVSTYHDNRVAVGLACLAVVLAIVAAWPWLHRFRIRWPVTISRPPSPAQTEFTDSPDPAEQLAILKSQRDEAARMREHWFAMHTFGTKIPECQSQSEAEIQANRDALHEIKSKLRAALSGSVEVWVYLSELAKKHRFLDLWTERVNRTERDRAESALNHLEGRLQFGGDPRPYLVLTYTRYREWRACVARLAELQNHPIMATPAGLVWAKAESRMIEALHDKLEIPRLACVKDAVMVYDESHGPMAELS
jgi:hypothetical protein